MSRLPLYDIFSKGIAVRYFCKFYVFINFVLSLMNFCLPFTKFYTMEVIIQSLGGLY